MFSWPLPRSVFLFVIIRLSENCKRIPQPRFDWSVMTALMAFCLLWLWPDSNPQTPTQISSSPLLPSPTPMNNHCAKEAESQKKQARRGRQREGGRERGLWGGQSEGSEVHVLRRCVLSSFRHCKKEQQSIFLSSFVKVCLSAVVKEAE